MKFMILCHTRSGSNLLVNLLSSHPQLKLYGEIFSLDRRNLEDVQYIIEYPIEYLKKKLNSNSSSIQGIGFKMLYDNFKLDYFDKEITLETSNPTLRKRNYTLNDFIFNKFSEEQLKFQFDKLWNFYKEDEELKILHLRRRNLLKTFISLKRAFISDEWISISDKKDQNYKVQIEKAELDNYFDRIHSFNTHYNKYFSQHQTYNLTYEDLVEKKEEVMSNTLNFLGVESLKLNSVLKKQNKASLRDSVSNYDQLKEQFANTKWIGFFED